MPSRAELNIRARNVGIDPSNYPNDSKLEQRVIYEEKNSATEAGALATGVLTGSANFADGETVTIGDTTYTFQSTLDDTEANNILVQADLATSLDVLKDAINATETVATAGTDYSTPTQANTEVTATTNTATAQTVQAISYDSGNNIATTETCANAAWGDTTLTGGDPKVVAADADDNQALSGGARV